MIDLTVVPFLVGLFSATHCLGMCSGIAGLLTAGLPPAVRRSHRHHSTYLALYHLARISSYAAAGTFTGALGNEISTWLAPELGHRLLQALSGIFLLGIGLYIAGWLPLLNHLERLGVPLWRRIEPLAKRLLPIDTPTKAFAFGLLWGWLPCGMVYTVIVYATTHADALHSGLFMFFFGLGTLPATLSAGWAGGLSLRLLQHPVTRKIIGVGIAMVALMTLFYPMLVKEMGWPLEYIVDEPTPR